MAAQEALEQFCDEPIGVISDSAYLANCFNQR